MSDSTRPQGEAPADCCDVTFVPAWGVVRGHDAGTHQILRPDGSEAFRGDTDAALTHLALAYDEMERMRTLALDLFTNLDEEYGGGIRNGYWPGVRPLWERARKELMIRD